MKTLIKIILFVAILSTLSFASDGNWANWRGPSQNGTAETGDYPTDWNLDSSQILWKIEIDGKGFSTPIVWDKTIYLTAGTDGQDTVIALDWAGKEIWRKQLGAETPGKHKNASGSNPSPVTDGKCVFVFFKSGHFAAVNPDGTIRWKMNLFEKFGKDERYWDFGTSPVLTKNYVVMAHMHDGESFVAAFDKQTGDLAWKVPRNYTTAREGRQGYTTPIVFSHEGKEALLVWGAEHLTAHDAADGKLIWSCGDFNPEGEKFWPSTSGAVLSGDVVVVPTGRADRGQPLLYGIKTGGTGDVTATHRLWKRDDISAFVPTPAQYKGRVYVVSDKGHIHCIDPKTGKDIWKDALSKAKGNVYASPLIAGEHLYITRERGMLYTAKLGEAFELVSEIDMGDILIASPIAVNNRLLIRTKQHLYSIGNK